MNKLEELKALLAKSNAAKATYDAVPDSYSNYMSSAKADAELSYLLSKLLPHLLAVAEAANEISGHGQGCSCIQTGRGRDCDCGVVQLWAAIEPLTKDADK